MEERKKDNRFWLVLVAMAAELTAACLTMIGNRFYVFAYFGEMALLSVFLLGVAGIVMPIIYLAGKNKRKVWVVLSIITMAIPATVFTAVILFFLLATTGVIVLM